MSEPAGTQIGPESTALLCPSCRSSIHTQVRFRDSMKTHFMFMALCFCVLCWPCAWLPYVLDGCKDVHHYCPACNAFIGSYRR